MNEKMTELRTLINRYGDSNIQLKELKRDVDNLNIKIKKVMQEQGLTEYSTSSYKLKCVTRKSESLDEEKVLQILKDNGITSVIRTKEYVDEAALETAIYNGDIDRSVLQAISACKVTKENVALTVKEI